jgi:hypothetical protein
MLQVTETDLTCKTGIGAVVPPQPPSQCLITHDPPGNALLLLEQSPIMLQRILRR